MAMAMVTDTVTDALTYSPLEKVMDAIPEAFELANTCVAQVFENPLLTLFFSISMIGTGLAIFRKLKKTAKA